MLDKVLKDISEFASGLRHGDLPPAIVDAAGIRILDSVGCAVSGWSCVSVQTADRLSADIPRGRGSGRLLCQPRHKPIETAAFMNTAAIRYLDFNDAYPGGHPSDMIGAFLALAEPLGKSGQAVAVATVAAYEVYNRISQGIVIKIPDRAVDAGLCATIGTAAGVSNLLGLSAEKTAHAVSIAASFGPPLRAMRSGQLSHWKGAASAATVRNGVFAALMASEGVTGPSHPFEGRHGLFDVLQRKFTLIPFGTAESDFIITGARLKYWPVAYNMQPSIWSAQSIRKQVAWDEIESIEVITDKFSVHESGSEAEKWSPTTRETADHSLPYCIAWTLINDRVTEETFEREHFSDPRLKGLMARIKIHDDPQVNAEWPHKIQSRMLVKDKAGRSYEAHTVNPPGHEANPLSLKDAGDKFLGLASPVLGDLQAREALRRWETMVEATLLDACFDSLILR